MHHRPSSNLGLAKEGAAGTIVFHKDLPATPEHFPRAVAPHRADVVVAVECIFTWDWLADLCSREAIPFVLGHAFYMEAIHGGKARNGKIDAPNIAVLLRGGMLPMAYVYVSLPLGVARVRRSALKRPQRARSFVRVHAR